MIISIIDHGESINWDAIMYSQLVKELIRWEKCHKSMIEGITKREPKKDLCHSAIVLKIMFQKVVSTRRSKAIGKEEIGITTIRGQNKKRHFEGEVH